MMPAVAPQTGTKRRQALFAWAHSRVKDLLVIVMSVVGAQVGEGSEDVRQQPLAALRAAGVVCKPWVEEHRLIG